MVSNEVLDALATAKQAFQQEGAAEEDLDVEREDVLQLRKSCRLLEAIEELGSIDGYYTLVIEASFAAIERIIQSYLIEKKILRGGEVVSSHEKIYEKGWQPGGLYPEGVKDELVLLWRENRSKTYYREGIGTREKADAMSDLAAELHTYILGVSSNSHECVCNR